MMSEEKYRIKIGEYIVADNVPREYFSVFVKAIFEQYYMEPNLTVTIERVQRLSSDVVTVKYGIE